MRGKGRALVAFANPALQRVDTPLQFREQVHTVGMISLLSLSKAFQFCFKQGQSVGALVIQGLGRQKLNIFGEFDGGVAALLVFFEVAHAEVHLRQNNRRKIYQRSIIHSRFVDLPPLLNPLPCSSWHFWITHAMLLRSPLPVPCPTGLTCTPAGSSPQDYSLCLSIIFRTISLSAPRSASILLRMCSGDSDWTVPKRSLIFTISSWSWCLRTKRSNFSRNSSSVIHLRPCEYHPMRPSEQPVWKGTASAGQNLEEDCEYLCVDSTCLREVASMRVMSSFVDWLLATFFVRYSSKSLITSPSLFLPTRRPPERAIFSIQRILGSRLGAMARGAGAGELSLLRWTRREADRFPKNFLLNCWSKGPQSVLDGGYVMPSCVISLFIIAVPKNPKSQKRFSDLNHHPISSPHTDTAINHFPQRTRTTLPVSDSARIRSKQDMRLMNGDRERLVCEWVDFSGIVIDSDGFMRVDCGLGLYFIDIFNMSGKPYGEGIELKEANARYEPNADFERPRTSTAIAREFQYLKQKINNDAVIDKERKISRMSRGLNPDAPKPYAPPKPPPVNEKEAEFRKKDQKAGEIMKMDEHRIPLEELCYRFGISLEAGLTTEAAVRRNLEEGDNKLPQKEKTPAWIRFLKELTNWFAIMLWIGSILCIITYIVQPYGNLPNLVLGFVLIAVILITGVITFAQAAQSEALMEGFKNMLPSVCKVLRDGKITQLPAEKLVRGDIVEVISGEKIPADLRVIKSTEMKVDNSALTGEVEPLLRSPECTHPEEPFETKNIAFFGTLCKEGRGRGIVIQIGANTVMGQIADLAATGGNQRSPLRIELDRFVLIITVIAISLGVIFFLLALLVVKYSALQCIIFGIGILVANVPEGLLACITISLAITAKRLAEKQVLVKNLEAVETLGSTSCICSDKTGTLTQNKMTVENLWIDGQVVRAHSKEVKGADFEYEYDVNDPSFKVLHHTAMICSEAKFDVSEEKKREPGFKYMNASVMGDASETALVKFYQPIEEITNTRDLYPLGKCKDNSESKMPFNSTNKYALSIVKSEGPDHHYVAYIKGAPEKIWKFCSRLLYEGKYKQIDAEEKKKFEAVNLRFGKNGERVLGFAMLPLNKEIYHANYGFVTSTPDNFNFPMENFIFVGLISLMDPPKESVPYAIKKCQSAGIKVIMVTGDQPPTAAAIAKQIGIITMKTNEDLKEEGFDAKEALERAKAIVIHGDMIMKAYEDGEEAGDATLDNWCLKKQIVFARTTPAQKLLIVKANQRLGAIVGVTGDGVNDSPAIKQGDIGISMGISGSDVTKDAADMILLNDDFGSIVDGVEEGRKIFDNLKKTIVYLLTSNMTEIWPFLALVLIQIPLPLSNIFMLCICVGTDIYPALSLAYEEAEVDIMTRRPRKPDEHLVSAKLLGHAYGNMGEIATCGGLFTYNLVMTCYGFPFEIYFQLLSKPAYINNSIGGITFNGNLGYPGSTFNIDSPYMGYGNATSSTYFNGNCSNSNLQSDQNFPNWLSLVNNNVDLRAVYVQCNSSATSSNLYSPQFKWPAWSSVLQDRSPISNNYVSFTTESIFYAQSGYFVTIVMVQWSNVFACKSRKMTIIYSGPNKHMFGGVLVETLLFVFLLYCPGVNSVFGGRPMPFFLLGIPGLGFSMLLLLWEESRKKLMNWDYHGDGSPNWFQRSLLW